jgi:hypothetical protein
MSNATLHRVARNRPAQRLISCSPIAQAIACSLILARELTFRNKIPTLGRFRDSPRLADPHCATPTAIAPSVSYAAAKLFVKTDFFIRAGFFCERHKKKCSDISFFVAERLCGRQRWLSAHHGSWTDPCHEVATELSPGWSPGDASRPRD